MAKKSKRQKDERKEELGLLCCMQDILSIHKPRVRLEAWGFRKVESTVYFWHGTSHILGNQQLLVTNGSPRKLEFTVGKYIILIPAY